MPLDVHAFFLPEGGVWAYLTVSFCIVYQFDDNSGSIYIYIYIQLRSVRGANKNSLSKVDNNEKQVSVHLIGLCIITRGSVG